MSTAPIALTAARHGPISRDDDRRVTFAGLVVAAALLGLAIGSMLLPEAVRRGAWLPTHLALAGAASTAVAAVLPFFTASLAFAAPVGRGPRILGVAGIASGAVLVSVGVSGNLDTLAVAGGLIYLIGLAATAYAALVPLRHSFGPRRPLVVRAYAVAIACVAVGVTLSISFLAGFGPIVERWALLKPAHAWLNVVGFLSLIVAATLVHLAPTVEGGRIQPRTSARVAIGALAVGPPLVAIGLALASGAVVRVGVVATTVGAVALTVHGLAVRRDRGRWTTDPGWHQMSGWSLVLAPVWLTIGIVAAGSGFLVGGADPAAWSFATAAPALAMGWVGQVLVGSWTQLLPAIGPGDPVAHARQRVVLGRAATARVMALQVGVAVATVGAVTHDGPIADVGFGLAGIALALSVALFLDAARIGLGFVTSRRALVGTTPGRGGARPVDGAPD
jgi:hypothetical protein